MQNGTSLKIFSGNSNKPLAQEICNYLSVPLGDALVTSFPDSESFVRFNENIRGTDVFLVQSTSSPANHNVMELLIMIDAAKRASAARVTAVLPFFGYARQDRKDQPRVPITSKLVANLLVAAGVNRILTMDLHAQQIQGFFDIPVDHLYASPVFFEDLRSRETENLTIFSPDVGGMKMANAYAEVLGCPLGFVAKRRTGASTVEAMNLVGEVEGREILLVDDMTETAGTLTAAAKILKERGAQKVSALVSHCMLNDTGRERLRQGLLDELITTNTVTMENEDLPVRQLSVANLLGEAIRRTHTDSSISNLFQIKGF
ncbi:MAG: ribose-phosphate pyrophosphokinase [Verrucomicrobiota bacterium]|nr:ribose-phosphate pyrophosphokinase [Opitutae bacterium]MEC7394621.1 ribose-phosphate pyrophosphokinase [Verrucomicrobiota bacterium]MEC7543564.1 ribose-phosphate pyrophosphokinase [Verrucomicrobiota bacterium]MEC7627258.1 ribose-phosphate pyrophosphokinase [Verrucomicrobiota bacterium]MEC8655780.1 ribose-phosphate pyrophosphokinase [Verrucomicrobiota bacterium]